MKRSKMLHHVAELIAMVRYEDAINESCRAPTVPSEEYAETFLSKLEELGMLPPEYENYNPDQVSRTFSNDSDWGRGEDGPNGEYRSYLRQNKWEPE